MSKETVERNKEIRRRYLDGESVINLKEEYGFSRQYIYQVIGGVKNNQATIRHRRRKIYIKAHPELTNQEMAETLKKSQNRVSSIRKKAGYLYNKQFRRSKEDVNIQY